MKKNYDALALLSGGLDSILAIRTVMDQGLTVLGLHFVTPFFGKPHLIPFWREHYGIEAVAVDIRQQYVDMMLDGPSQGFGKWLNPCIDCKITMLSHAVKLLPEYGAKFLVSGEVVGQRPMSQRADALNLITKRAHVRDVLLRPLSAKNLKPTPMETSGLVDRDQLLDWSGRGRKPQYALAEAYGFTEIPTPGGGCCLTEASGAARFVQVLIHRPRPTATDFSLARAGRQYWAGSHWLTFGRTAEDNQQIESCVESTDYIFKVANFPGPLAVGRPVAGEWSPEALQDAAALMASYSGKARKHFQATGEKVEVTVDRGTSTETLRVIPTRETVFAWTEPKPELVKEWKKLQIESEA
ncbi:tRNA(5-methylaminomethyl-2-thiouridylate) methyltransferase [Pseudodesulfovibrio sp. JC047]|uniref:tRNA(5-methylaminomethyl-2-thiouridylate) methyltransferase n=1 Tax=Pseudodesulfovibrio sp. JC047 TaxID=2683199 RepID=UPI0013D5EB4D|nr:tRNA(5-methylaminomethyl-2-thiouridylate) methyltransferase [Pseudodesulfovibrio sp. JC047]NDV18924.1 tRNA(5-methylaminomethyl-2-thiouridylate) methyltransferase [Pseudodesulfovibrio sp. JC047]